MLAQKSRWTEPVSQTTGMLATMLHHNYVISLFTVLLPRDRKTMKIKMIF